MFTDGLGLSLNTELKHLPQQSTSQTLLLLVPSPTLAQLHLVHRCLNEWIDQTRISFSLQPQATQQEDRLFREQREQRSPPPNGSGVSYSHLYQFAQGDKTAPGTMVSGWWSYWLSCCLSFCSVGLRLSLKIKNRHQDCGARALRLCCEEEPHTDCLTPWANFASHIGRQTPSQLSGVCSLDIRGIISWILCTLTVCG